MAEEDDYMGDLSQFLPTEASLPPKPSSQAGPGWDRREDPKKEKMRKAEMRTSRKRVKEEELMAEFGCRLKEHWRSRRVVVNFHKAKLALAQLENKEVVEEKKDDEDGGNEEGEEEEEITE